MSKMIRKNSLVLTIQVKENVLNSLCFLSKRGHIPNACFLAPFVFHVVLERPGTCLRTSRKLHIRSRIFRALFSTSAAYLILKLKIIIV